MNRSPNPPTRAPITSRTSTDVIGSYEDASRLMNTRPERRESKRSSSISGDDYEDTPRPSRKERRRSSGASSIAVDDLIGEP